MDFQEIKDMRNWNKEAKGLIASLADDFIELYERVERAKATLRRLGEANVGNPESITEAVLKQLEEQK